MSKCSNILSSLAIQMKAFEEFSVSAVLFAFEVFEVQFFSIFFFEQNSTYTFVVCVSELFQDVLRLERDELKELLREQRV